MKINQRKSLISVFIELVINCHNKIISMSAINALKAPFISSGLFNLKYTFILLLDA